MKQVLVWIQDELYMAKNLMFMAVFLFPTMTHHAKL